MILIKTKRKRYVFKGIKTDYYIDTKGLVYIKKDNKFVEVKQYLSNKGYKYVHLNRDNHSYILLVHRMVAETFIPNPYNKRFVNHIDGCKTNNDVSNLEWTTPKENSVHAYTHGLMGFGEDFATSKISDDTALAICDYLQNTSWSLAKIAEKVDCSKKVVSDIYSGKTWKYFSEQFNFDHRKHQSKITKKTAEKICNLLLTTNYSSKEISEMVGCKVHIVKDIRRGRSWKDVYEKVYNKVSSTTREK